MRRLILFLLAATLAAGCSWLGFGNNDKDQQGAVSVDKPLVDVEFVRSGRINHLQRLQEGGRLLVKPFSAGPNIEMNEELDAVSLRIVRGILDVYEGIWPEDAPEGKFVTETFDMAVLEDEEESDLKVYGRITEITSSANWKKWVLIKHKSRLSVEGWLVDVRNKQTILSFKDTVEAKTEEATFRDLGLDIGRHIGQFIFAKRD
jgi:hypothetical protein